MEQKKNAFLVALYEKKYSTVESLYLDIFKHAEGLPDFNENTEKLLNQIQTIFKKFKPAILKHCSSTIKNIHCDLKNIIKNHIHKRSHNICHVDFPAWEKALGLNRIQKDLLYKTAMTFQLTSGCSNFCRRCNEWAIPKVRSHFSYKSIQKISNRIHRQGNVEISLYGASDPLDWAEDKKSIVDIIDHLDALPLEYSILTKVPKGKSLLLKKLLKKKSNLSVSMTSKNKTRITKIEHSLNTSISKQHDLDELLIPAGLDEDFISVKSSITDGYGTELTPDGAFIIIPTFTSALHPFGHQKIPVTEKTDFFPIKKTGRSALLVDYFKPLEGYDLNKRQCHMTHLLDIQIESMILDTGTDRLTPPGMRNLKEYLYIFEETARLQRKKITQSVLKKLKTQFLSTLSFQNVSHKNRILYLKKINTHLDLCKKTGCLSSKLLAISFFLASICHYVRKNPIKVKMMQVLLKDEIHPAFKAWAALLADRSVETVLKDPKMDSFDIFRGCVACLLINPEQTAVLSFISAYPSMFDPVADIFVPC